MLGATQNWLFLGSDEGARVNTVFVSLLASCQLHGIELAPAFWKQTREQQDTQQRLAANVFRAATLVDHAPPV